MARKSVAGGSWGRRQGAVVSPSSPPSPAHSSLEWLSLQTSTLWIQGLSAPDEGLPGPLIHEDAVLDVFLQRPSPRPTS